MAEIQQTHGRTLVNYMARDYDTLLQSMRDLIPSKLPEWTDFDSEADFGNVLLQLFAHMGDLLSYYQDRIANESFLGTAQTRYSVIHHSRLIGYRLATAAPAAASLNLTVKPDYNGVMTIQKGDVFATKSQKDRASVRFEYTRAAPLKIDFTGSSKTFHGIPVEEGRLVQNEIIGQSNGTPNQRFSLAHPRLILRALGQGPQVNRDIILLTELGGGLTEWTFQESLAFSRAEQRDFVVEIDDQDRATILFGDGTLGAIPPAEATIKATYRVGGGRQGNVPANTIVTIVNAPQLLLAGASVTNPLAATGGAERESIDHAALHAPAVFRSLKRAVTKADYEALALQFKGVGKVRAEAGSWNVVNLFVAPEGGGHVSDVLRANLLTYFEDKRPITTTIEIEDVDYVEIYVTATIGVKSFYVPAEVSEQVRQAAANLLAFDNVDFKQALYLSKFYEAIEAVEGVAYVTITQFSRDKASTGVDSSGIILLGTNEIPRTPDDPEYAAGIKVRVEANQ